ELSSVAAEEATGGADGVQFFGGQVLLAEELRGLSLPMIGRDACLQLRLQALQFRLLLFVALLPIRKFLGGLGFDALTKLLLVADLFLLLIYDLLQALRTNAQRLQQ
ncbi:hypothetical protein, partial [Bordetella bronchiseptica]|uniref:hypothetical protein n=1 Tax=Bordetella bronchiseptica TaxID=518 RepID=UPI002FD88791